MKKRMTIRERAEKWTKSRPWHGPIAAYIAGYKAGRASKGCSKHGTKYKVCVACDSERATRLTRKRK